MHILYGFIKIIKTYKFSTTPRRRESSTSMPTSDFGDENLPEFCNGMAYLVTPDLTTDFLKASTMVSYMFYFCITIEIAATYTYIEKKC